MRIVVKVGTSTLAHPSGLLNIRHTEDLVKVWSDIQNAGASAYCRVVGGYRPGRRQTANRKAQRHHYQAGRRSRGPVRADVHLRPAVRPVQPHRGADAADLGGFRPRKPPAQPGKTRWNVFCSCTQSPSSTRTTPLPARNIPWATMTHWPHWWQRASTPTWSC